MRASTIIMFIIILALWIKKKGESKIDGSLVKYDIKYLTCESDIEYLS